MTTRVLFRADAGPRLGLGHLQRSLALGEALKSLGAESIFLGQDDPAGREYTARHGFHMQPLGDIPTWTPEDAETTIKAAAQNRCKAVVVDYHAAGTSYLALLRDAGLYVVARDDLASYSIPCQMLLNGNADAPGLPYRSSTEDTVFLLGPRYMVLRDQFLDPPTRTASPEVRNLLVMLGGANGPGLMHPILELLLKLPGNFTITAVVGPFFQGADEIRGLAATAGDRVRVLYSPHSVRDLMLEADLAVTAAGQTLYELACAGCPAVAIETASNQNGHLRVLAEAGVVVEAGDACRDDLTAILRDLLPPLMSDRDRRQRMAAAGQRMVDGRGAGRVAEAILAALGATARETKESRDAKAIPGR